MEHLLIKSPAEMSALTLGAFKNTKVLFELELSQGIYFLNIFLMESSKEIISKSY